MPVQIVKYVGQVLTVSTSVRNLANRQTIYTGAALQKPGTTYAIGLGSSIQPDNPVTLEPGESVDVDFTAEIPGEIAGVVVEAGLYDVIIQVFEDVGVGELVSEKVLSGEVEIKLHKKEILDITYA